MRARSTGVEIIDELVGGITPGLPCVLAGPSGAGRSVLSLQLAAASVEQGRVVTFLCNEPAPLLLRQASTLGLDLERAVESERLALLEMDPEIAAIANALGSEALIEALRAEQPLCSLLIVDPLSVVTAGVFDETHLRSLARGLVAKAADWMMVFTVESERLALQQGLERILGEVCGAFLRLSRDDEGRRRIDVDKTRTGVPLRPCLHFEIGEGGARWLPPAASVTPAAEPARADDPRPAAEAGPATDAGETPERAPIDDRALPADHAPERGDDADPVLGDEPEGRGPRGTRRARRTDGPAGPPVVLVVDSDRASRDRIVKWLDGPYDVETAEDGFEAMTWLMTRRPDLVILDLLMPRVTGFELLSALQRTRQEVPRLVISGRVTRPGDRLAPLVLGATDILPKPVDRIELVRKVEMLLRLESAPADLIDPLEAEDLFARISKTRLLDEADFLARLTRACSLGERLGLPSSIVAVSSTSSRALDLFLESSDEALRFEDATLRVSARRAVLLLVATEWEDASGAAERLCDAYRERGGRPEQLDLRVVPAQRVADDYDWHDLFRSTRADRRRKERS
jgi:DNA-binding response OmpR family regulator/KaiC/GvpD/RAD55 family RecA-like ATPase